MYAILLNASKFMEFIGKSFDYSLELLLNLEVICLFYECIHSNFETKILLVNTSDN